MRGASIVAGRRLVRRDAVAVITRVRDDQEAMLRTAGAVLLGPRLTLENVEQALCEFAKYEQLRLTGRIKRRFAPSRDDDGPWDSLPDRFTQEALWPANAV